MSNLDLDEGLMTVDEAGEFLAVSRTTVWALMQRGQLAWTSIGRSRRIPRASAKALILKGLSTGV